MDSRLQSTFKSLPKIVKYLVVLLVVVFISLLYPNNAKFPYEFDKGQRWSGDDLIAPFDFAILKSEEELKSEQEDLEDNFSPYYEMDLELTRRQKQNFEQLFASQLQSVKSGGQFKDVVSHPEKYSSFGKGFINRVYNKGIVTLRPVDKDKGKDFVINIRKGNTTYKATVQNLLSPEQLEERIPDTLFNSGLKEAEFLIPLLKESLAPNVFYSDTLTQKFRQQITEEISRTRDLVRKGELIIPNGAVIRDELYQVLYSYKVQYEKEVTTAASWLGIYIGYFLLTGLIIGIFLIYIQLNEKHVFDNANKLIFMLLWLVVYSYLVYWVDSHQLLNIYVLPFCIVPIIVNVFFNGRLALFIHIVIVLIASFLSTQGYEFTFLQILAGIVAVLTNVRLRHMSEFFLALLYILLTYCIGFTGLWLIREGSFATMDWSIYSWLFFNVFLTLLAYPLVPLAERLFGFLSPITLVELSDMNNPLLKQLSIKAPGTLQHSLQVANLSEAAASKIKGADPLLVKVASLYHDIGKMKHPEYFIENLDGVNPHTKLNDLESAKVIIEHVTEGLRLAKKHHLPTILSRFIATHHGTTRVEYFYKNFVNDHPASDVDEAAFQYPGPRPSSKEESILMMADSIEAACKSVKATTEAEINKIVDKIITGKIARGQLELSALSFKELEICKRSFKKLLKSIYHVRVEYPED